MPTMLTLLQDLAQRLNDDENFPTTGTGTDATTTTLVDSGLAVRPGLLYSSGDANIYDGKFVYIEPHSDETRVTEGGYAGSTGTLTLSPALVGDIGATGTASATDSTSLTDSGASFGTDGTGFDGAVVQADDSRLTITSNTGTALTGTGGWDNGTPASNATYTVGPPYIISNISFAVKKRAINRVLRNIFLPSFFPLSMHIVGNDANDMESSTIVTDYGKTTNATLAIESTIVYNGAQSLKVTAGADEEWAFTGLIFVNEGQSLYVAAYCSVQVGDAAELRIVDGDSLATIDNATNDEMAWMSLMFQFTIPSGTEQIRAYLISTSNGDISYWDDLQLWPTGKAVYPLPSWITRPDQMLDVRAFPRGTGGPASDNDWRSNEQRSVPLAWGFERVDKTATNELHIWVEATGSRRPFIYALRPLSELTTDSATTVGEQDDVLFWAERLIREPERASEILKLIRARAFVRPTVKLPDRIGVSAN